MTTICANIHDARDYIMKCADIAVMLVRLHCRVGATFLLPFTRQTRIARENKR